MCWSASKIYDFQVQQDLHLQAFIRDKVHIFEETDHWYLACLARNTGIRGIIPKVRIICDVLADSLQAVTIG